MLLNLYKERWTSGMTLIPPKELSEKTCSNMESMGKLAVDYAKRIDEEIKKVTDLLCRTKRSYWSRTQVSWIPRST